MSQTQEADDITFIINSDNIELNTDVNTLYYQIFSNNTLNKVIKITSNIGSTV